jgi:UDP-N-acetylglucosamine/UDP-N-acetyl-alpha-D-glucosaminouronate 4-epimerase
VTSSSLTCLVTGGAGFIGSHVAESLVRDGHSVRVVDNLSTGDRANLEVLGGKAEFVLGDLTDPAVCRRVTQGVQVVWHLAALPSVPRSMQDPKGCHEHNVNATVNLLLAARESGVRRVVYSSSSSAYGDTPVLPKVETAEPLPRSPYAAAKLAGEQYVLAFARAGMIEGVALRYFNVFGPRQSPTSAYAAVIPAWLAAALAGRPARLFGDGTQTRDFTYVENVVEANWLAATLSVERVNGWVVNVGAGTRSSLLDLARLIGEVTGRPLALETAPVRAGDVQDSLASLERARSVLGYEPRVTLRTGLERTLEWIRNATVPSV